MVDLFLLDFDQEVLPFFLVDDGDVLLCKFHCICCHSDKQPLDFEHEFLEFFLFF